MTVGEKPGSESAWYAFMGFDPEQNRRARGFYVSLYEGCQSVLDVACGRGEFLDVLRSKGIKGEGVDADAGMVAAARAAGNEVACEDAFSFLEAHRGSFDGIFSAHFIEHLDPERALRLIALSADALQPGGRIVLATPNAASLPTLQREFWWDSTHVRMYDRDLLRFWLSEAGFEGVEAGENPLSHAGSPVGLKELEIPSIPPLGRFARFVRVLDQRTQLTHHHLTVVADSLRGLLQELYRPSEIYATGRKRAS